MRLWSFLFAPGIVAGPVAGRIPVFNKSFSGRAGVCETRPDRSKCHRSGRLRPHVVARADSKRRSLWSSSGSRNFSIVTTSNL